MKLLLILLLYLHASQLVAQVQGCTDPLAINYDQNASINNGSCIYSASSVNPE